MLTTTQVSNFNAGQYTAAINNWGDAANALRSASTEVVGVTKMKGWKGAAADAALASLNRLGTMQKSSPTLLDEAQDTLAMFVATMTQQREKLLAEITKARQLNCTVGEDGTVTPPPPPPPLLPPPKNGPPAASEFPPLSQPQAEYDALLGQAQDLEKAIVQILQSATAADNRAQSDLGDGIKGATDAQDVVTNKDPGVAAKDLSKETTDLAAGRKWLDKDGISVAADLPDTVDGDRLVQQYAKQAAKLLPEAANGDPSAIAKLKDLSPLSTNQVFALDLMNDLGAKGLENLPVIMNGQINGLSNGNDYDALEARSKEYYGILQFLSDSLASASNTGKLKPGFIEALTDNSTAKGNTEQLGLWSIGQILGASSGAVQYNPQFLNTVGTAIINFDQANPGYPLPDPGTWSSNTMNDLDNLNFGTWDWPANIWSSLFDSPASPVYGLLHAAALSPQASLELLSSNDYANLNDLMNRWWSIDQGSALGAAIAAAGDQPGSKADALSSQAVSDYMSHLGSMQDGKFVTTSYNGGDLAGINAGMGLVLGYHMNQVYQCWSPPGYPAGEADNFPNDQQGLAALLGAVSSSPAGYQALLAGAVATMKQNIGPAAQSVGSLLANPNANPNQLSEAQQAFNTKVGFQANFLGYIVGAHNEALVAGGLQKDATAAQNAAQAAMVGSFVSQGIGLIPIPGSGLFGTAFKDVLQDAVTRGTAASGSDTNYENALSAAGTSFNDGENLWGQVVGSTMVSNGVWYPGSDPSTWLTAQNQALQQKGEPPLPPFFTTTTLPDGSTQYNLVANMSAKQMAAFEDWSRDGNAVGTVGTAFLQAGSSFDVGANQAAENLNSAKYPYVKP